MPNMNQVNQVIELIRLEGDDYEIEMVKLKHCCRRGSDDTAGKSWSCVASFQTSLASLS